MKKIILTLAMVFSFTCLNANCKEVYNNSNREAKLMMDFVIGKIEDEAKELYPNSPALRVIHSMEELAKFNEKQGDRNGF